MDSLSREMILNALKCLADELADRQSRAELVLVGGAAMVVLFGARETTKDVDAFVVDSHGPADVRAVSRLLADELGLPTDWLNDAAKGYLHGMSRGEVVFSSSSLTVRTPATEQLLAMKLSAWRDDLDVQDARLLLSKLHGDPHSTWVRVEPYVVPGRELKARYAFDDLVEQSDEPE